MMRVHTAQGRSHTTVYTCTLMHYGYTDLIISLTTRHYSTRPDTCTLYMLTRHGAGALRFCASNDIEDSMYKGFECTLYSSYR